MDINEAAQLCCSREPLDAAVVLQAVSIDPQLLDSRTEITGESLLDMAVSCGNTDLVAGLLLAGVDPNRFEPPNDIPLIKAVRSSSPNAVAIVRLLIQHGANVNAAGVLDGSALHAAVAESSKELVDLLLQKGAHIDICSDTDKCTPLWCAVLWESVEMVQLLLARGANFQLRNNTVSTAPLDEAIRNGNANILRTLLEAGADPNVRGLGRETPLINVSISASSNAIDIVHLLLEFGADINAPGETLESPLHAAVMLAPVDFVRFLLRRGANVNQRSKDGMTPIGIAEDRGDRALVDLLLAHGAVENIR